ncbi:hypothetical protein Csa_001865, partial [Cucumis sativus]
MIQVHNKKLLDFVHYSRDLEGKKELVKCKDEWKNPIGSNSDILMVNDSTKPNRKRAT